MGKYTFVVDKSANKDAVARSCHDLFGVNVESVNLANIKGKIKMTKRVKGKRSDYKKAVITLKSGEKIDLFETQENEKKDKKDLKKEEKVEKAKKAKESKDVEISIKSK